MKLRSTPSKPSRSLVTISGSPAAGGGRLSRPRRRFSAASTTSRGEFLHRVLPGFVHLALGAGADICDLRLGAHPAVAHLVALGLKRGDAGRGGLHELLRRAGHPLSCASPAGSTEKKGSVFSGVAAHGGFS